jgi:hypothetical protein
MSARINATGMIFMKDKLMRYYRWIFRTLKSPKDMERCIKKTDHFILVNFSWVKPKEKGFISSQTALIFQEISLITKPTAGKDIINHSSTNTMVK